MHHPEQIKLHQVLIQTGEARKSNRGVPRQPVRLDSGLVRSNVVLLAARIDFS